MERAPHSDINHAMATVGALLGGAVGAAVWWGFTVLTRLDFGLVAVVIGFAVGHGILMFTGRKRSVSLQFLSVTIAAVAFVLACYYVNRALIMSKLYAEQGVFVPLLPDLSMFLEVLREGFGILDVVFLAVTLFEAWKIPEPRRTGG